MQRAIKKMKIESTLPESIETERLIIRVAKPGDGAVMNAAIKASHETLSPWLGWVTPVPSVEESEEGCRNAYGRFLLNVDLMVLIFDKESGGLVGGSGLHDADWEKRQFEIGYWGNVEFSGRGLMTEAVNAIAHYALKKLGAQRVFLTTDEQNIHSWKLAERAGFEFEGTLRNDRYNLQGALRNTKVYSMIPAK
jgi:RimJ/RimL family protein N-acetyltransferase